MTRSKGFKALPASYSLPKILRLRSSLTVTKEYALDNHRRMETILSEQLISVLRPDNDFAKSIYKRRNVLAPLTVE